MKTALRIMFLPIDRFGAGPITGAEAAWLVARAVRFYGSRTEYLAALTADSQRWPEPHGS